MLDFLTVFVSGYLSVFLLGFQSRLVNTGNYIGAALCSFTIAMFQATLWAKLMQGHSGWSNTIAYGLAGSAAITSAIWAHKRLFPDKITTSELASRKDNNNESRKKDRQMGQRAVPV